MKTILGVAAVLLLVSCGDGAKSPGAGQSSSDAGAVGAGDGGSPIEIAQAEFRKAVCDRIYGCCSAADRMGNDTIGTDAESCQDALEGETLFFLADIEASVTQGRVVYHADKMAACLDGLRTRGCDAIKMPAGDLDIIDMCDGVFEPKVPIGGSCLEYWDCIGGWCAGDLGDLKDTCTPRAEEGAVCDEGPECFTRICDDNKCVKRPAGSGSLCKLGTTSEGQHTPAGPSGVTDAGTR